jgi:hypothetical protein
MALANIPRPRPDIKDPTKYSGDCCRKKNPTPKPTITPPPIAQVLLSSFSLDIMKFMGLNYLKIWQNQKQFCKV